MPRYFWATILIFWLPSIAFYFILLKRLSVLQQKAFFFIYAVTLGLSFCYGFKTGEWFPVSVAISVIAVAGLLVYSHLIKKAENNIFSKEKRTAFVDIIPGILHIFRNQLNGIGASVANMVDIMECVINRNPAVVSSADVTDFRESSSAFKNFITSAKLTWDRVSDLAKTASKPVDFGQYSFKEITQLAIERVMSFYHADKIAVSIEAADDDKIYGAKNQLVTIMENLLSNAYIAITDKPGALSDAEKKDFAPLIVAGLKDAGSQQIISVSDNGIGMNEHVRAIVFKPFRRGGTSFVRSGAGMFTAREILKNTYGGNIWFETEYKKGSTFYIALPKNATFVKEGVGE